MTTETRWLQSAGSWLIHALLECTQITKMDKLSRMITYTMSDLCQIQRESRMEYNRFTLCYVLMSKIISMALKDSHKIKLTEDQGQEGIFSIRYTSFPEGWWLRTRHGGTTTINYAHLSLITKSITPGWFFTLSQVNIRSTRNKIGQFQQHLTKSSTDIYVLLETWLKDSNVEKLW